MLHCTCSNALKSGLIENESIRSMLDLFSLLTERTDLLLFIVNTISPFIFSLFHHRTLKNDWIDNKHSTCFIL